MDMFQVCKVLDRDLVAYLIMQCCHLHVVLTFKYILLLKTFAKLDIAINVSTL